MSLPSTQSALLEPSLEPSVTPPLPEAVLSALQRGQIADAIRLLRLEQHIGLNDAKQQIDAYLMGQPTLRYRIDQVQTDSREGVLRWITFLLIGGVGLVYVLI